MASKITKINKLYRKYAGGGLLILIVFLIISFILSLFVPKATFAGWVPLRGIVILIFFVYFSLCHIYVTPKGFAVIKPTSIIYEYKTKLGQSVGLAIGLLYFGISIWFLLQGINLLVK